MAAYRQFFRSPSYENQSYRCAAFLILAGQPTRAAAVLISRAAPEAVASAIIPGMLKTQWRLVSESPHVQLWERPSANKIVNFFGSLTDLDTHVPVERVSYTIAAAQGGTFVQSTQLSFAAQEFHVGPRQGRPLSDAAALLGHSRGFSWDVYSSGPGLKRLRDLVEKVAFTSLRLDHPHATAQDSSASGTAIIPGAHVEHRREQKLPAFSLSVGELEALWLHLTKLFDNPVKIYTVIEIRLPSAQLRCKYRRVEAAHRPSIQGHEVRYSVFTERSLALDLYIKVRRRL